MNELQTNSLTPCCAVALTAVPLLHALEMAECKELPPEPGERQLWRIETAVGDYCIRRISPAEAKRRQVGMFFPQKNPGVFVVDQLTSDGTRANTGSLPAKLYHSMREAKTALTRFLRERTQRIAYHEAGHLVAALRLSIPLKEHGAAAVIVQNRETLGHVSFRDGGLPIDCLRIDGRDRLESVERYCVCLLAGKGAVAVHTGEWSESLIGSEYSKDYDAAKEMLEWLLSAQAPHEYPLEIAEDVRAYIRVLEFRAAWLVKENWTSVEALAMALLDRGALSAAEAREIAL